MTGNTDNGLAFTLLLVTLTLTFSQGETTVCQPGYSRPHPRGFCGSALARLHANFCLLLRWAYPEHFPVGKRSAEVNGPRHLIPRAIHPAAFMAQAGYRTSEGSSPNIYGIPLSLLAETSFTNREQLSDLMHRHGDTDGIPSLHDGLEKPFLDEHEVSDDWSIHVTSSSSPANPFFRLLSKRSTRGKRSLVCDCCYNACSERKLAVYC